MSLKALFYPDVPFEHLYVPHIYKEIYFDCVYVDVCNTKRDMVIVDVGANIGIVTQFLRDYAKKLYAIEPSSQHFEALKKNKEFNEWDNVEVFNLAIADKDGEMQLSLHADNKTMHSLMFANKFPGWYPGCEMVKTLSMKSFFDSNNIEVVDFMKFDVEGAEDMILRSEDFVNVAHKIKAIEVEFHFEGWENLVEHMKKLGFSTKKLKANANIILFTR